MLEGLWLNLRLPAVCGAAVLVLGLLLAVARTLRGPVFFPLRAPDTAYTDFFRGLPLIICLLMVVFGVPALRLQGATNDPVLLGGSALMLTYSAYVAEVFRAGIESVHPSQRAAARSLGLSSGQALRFVVLPQAVRRVVPPLLNDLVSLQKGADHPDDPAHRLGDGPYGPAAGAGRAGMSTDTGTAPVLRMEAVRKSFGTSLVLRDVDLEVAPRRVHGLSRARAETDARELLEWLGLGAKADECPDRLSGGQQ